MTLVALVLSSIASIASVPAQEECLTIATVTNSQGHLGLPVPNAVFWAHTVAYTKYPISSARFAVACPDVSDEQCVTISEVGVTMVGKFTDPAVCSFEICSSTLPLESALTEPTWRIGRLHFRRRAAEYVLVGCFRFGRQ